KMAGPLRRTDEYGNPVPEHQGPGGAVTGGTYGTTTTPHEGVLHGEGGREQQVHLGKEEHPGGRHHRSGSSSSSSSSEDDGQGGRRKKGLKEKIKEKLPGGGHKSEEHGQTDEGQHEKKGMMEKIKEKLPGHH
ncbi:hypothetical protein, partial [Klebsiella pneumoniae]|uniref:hypothetical protein n=1 Tax=Klebsiella pneumoniae TaxID=573 RepID=UPI0015851F80